MVRLARALWIAWAVIAWNVVFDHVIVDAGRRYVYAAAVAAAQGRPYLRMDDWMRPALSRGLWIASAVAGVILVVGLFAIARGARGVRHHLIPPDPCTQAVSDGV